jgi:hypothetical protein
MEIRELIDKQLKDTRQNQISFQAMIKKRLKKHGFNRDKLAPEFKKDIDRLSKRIVNNSLNLGLEWLQE